MVFDFKKVDVFLKSCPRILLGIRIRPNSDNEDVSRVEFILNIILLFSIFLATTAFMSVVQHSVAMGDSYKGDSPFFIASILMLFVGLLVLSRKGFIKIASYLVVFLYFLAVSSGVYYFGADQAQTLLSYTVIIVIAGILLGTRFAFVTTLAVIFVILIFGLLQIHGVHSVYSSWKQARLDLTDITFFSITFSILAVVSWLSNREIEKSLIRARGAEKELRMERDFLEIKVKERTEELERMQFEKTKQMQNFIEFGRNASGLFHDMVNPVQAAILSLYTLKKNASINDHAGLNNSVDDVVKQMEKAREFINTARNQITRQEININFDPEEQIAFVFQMLSFRAKREKVELMYSPYNSPLLLKGNPLSFHRLIAGLVSNAIDAYDEVTAKAEDSRAVTVTSGRKGEHLYFSVIDNGKGISKENQTKIFELFFTTKGIEKGTGIGLALCKEIVEKEFGGTLGFASQEGVGSTFIVKLPIKD